MSNVQTTNIKKTTFSTILTTIIKEIRIERGLSMREIADAVGITTSGYSKWESKGSYPSLESMFTLSRVLGVPTSHILRTSENLAISMTHKGWQVVNETLETDDLLELAKDHTFKPTVGSMGILSTKIPQNSIFMKILDMS